MILGATSEEREGTDDGMVVWNQIQPKNLQRNKRNVLLLGLGGYQIFVSWFSG